MTLDDLKNKVILVTGGTGSFGHKVATYLSSKNPKEIRIYSRDEKKQWDMHNRWKDFTYLIGDVRDYERLAQAMKGVDYVFHAAALKQVPSCEKFPMEAVKTNILGSNNACEAAERAGVKVFVGLSTDKAVKPINAMGTSKALMEKIIISRNQFESSTKFCCVRYGNVMGSRGSVIPHFQSQIEQGVPMTITIPEMTRFLMTLEESVDLVLHALLHAKGGEIFVRKAPACRVDLLAKALAEKYSPKRGKHPIQIVGPRPGEKLDEILVNEYEWMRSKENDTFFTVESEYRAPIANSTKKFGYEYTSANTNQLTTVAEVLALLERMESSEIHLLAA